MANQTHIYMTFVLPVTDEGLDDEAFAEKLGAFELDRVISVRNGEAVLVIGRRVGSRASRVW